MTSTVEVRDYLFIDGERTTPSTTDTIRVISPNTGYEIGSVPEARSKDIDAAVHAARRAFSEPGRWGSWDPARRAETLRAFADAVEGRLEHISQLVSSQNGMPITYSAATDTGAGPALLRYYASLVGDLSDQHRVTDSTRSVITNQPAGVVAAIVPWNFPQALAFTKIAPALAAGCTVVFKPSPETVLDAYQLAEAAEEAHLPPGVLNIAPGGRDTGAYLVSHPGVDHVAFTGSSAAGRLVGAECGRLLRPFTLELGGKSAGIVLDDANLAAHLDAFYGATLLNNGQTCYLSSRILLPRTRYSELVDLVTDFVGGLLVGSSLEPATQIGPVVTQRQQAKILALLDRAQAGGARLTTGGGRQPGADNGWFVAPTVFADVDNHSEIAAEEIFGPVVCLLPYDDIEDAVHIANESEYGLQGSVWTDDVERGEQVARAIHSGGVSINGTPMDIYSPFGGVKASGVGRELGPEALRNYIEPKSIYLPPV